MSKIYLEVFHFQARRDTAKNWNTSNPILCDGEFGIVTDSVDENWLKVGDGATPWKLLPFKKGPKGNKGDKGDPFVYSDFTDEQLALLKGAKGDTGNTGPRGLQGEKGDTGATGATGAKGDKGDKGDAFTYEDFTAEQLAELKGAKGDKGDKGDTGEVTKEQMNAAIAAEVSAEKNRANNAFANALKGAVSGSAVRMDDVSPVEHTLGVKVRNKNLFDKTIPYSNYATDSETQYGTLRFYVGVGTPVTISFTAPTEAFTAKYMFVTFSHLAKSEQSAITKYQWLILNDEVVKTVWTNTSVDGYFSLAMTEATYNLILNNSIQIEIGTTATTYTPYISDLSTVTVTRRGKNLFDINNPTYAARSKVNTAFLPTIKDGVISFNTYYAQRGGSGFVIPVEPNTTITISFDSVGSDYWTEILAVESILDNVVINTYLYPQFKNITKYTLTQQAGKHYILFMLDGVNGFHTAKIKNLQIEKGSTATPYEPYQGQTYTSTATGEVVGVKSLYPTTTLITDTEGVIIEAEYNRDINKAFAEMQQAILSLGGNV